MRIPADPVRVEELRKELMTDLGASHAVESIARHYAQQEARADAAEEKLKAIGLAIVRECFDCDVAAEMIDDIKGVLDD